MSSDKYDLVEEPVHLFFCAPSFEYNSATARYAGVPWAKYAIAASQSSYSLLLLLRASWTAAYVYEYMNGPQTLLVQQW